MRQFRKILVAYDGSKASDKALREAIVLAEKFCGTIVLTQVVREKSEEEALSQLKPIEKRIKESGVEYATRIECDLYPPRKIVKVAMDEACDLITIGGKRVGEANYWAMGSVSKRVVEDAFCPVLVVK